MRPLREGLEEGKQAIRDERDARPVSIYLDRRWPLWRVRYERENDAWFWKRSSAVRYYMLIADREVHVWGKYVKIYTPNGILGAGPS